MRRRRSATRLQSHGLIAAADRLIERAPETRRRRLCIVKTGGAAAERRPCHRGVALFPSSEAELIAELIRRDHRIMTRRFRGVPLPA
jgi:hypothetical protein